jgi:hypothetical protein
MDEGAVASRIFTNLSLIWSSYGVRDLAYTFCVLTHNLSVDRKGASACTARLLTRLHPSNFAANADGYKTTNTYLVLDRMFEMQLGNEFDNLLLS